MLRKHLDYYLRYLNHDIPAGVVVFLVALPLCLGIAVASGAPPFSGVIAGVVGGLVVSVVSGSQLSVSGPAAGLTVIIANSVEKLGLDGMLLAVAVSGLIQIAMGFLRAGVIGAYFPSAVIKGMLAAIGLILIMKQLPHAVGYDADADSDLSFLEDDSHTTFSFLWSSLDSISPGATVVSIVSVAILLFWDTEKVKNSRILSLIPGALVAVIFGIVFNQIAQTIAPFFAIAPQHLVTLPAISGPLQFLGEIHIPSLGALTDPHVYITAGTLALIGSLETLLSLEAVDKLDPLKRTAPTNLELKAQGVGNFISGLIGGLPITAVIVRSSANINAGAHTKVACIVHGWLLLLSVMFLSSLLNTIPLACLAAVLLLTGYKLAKPKLVMEQYEKGFNQFAPFAVTVAAILMTDLLKGMAIGMAVGLFFVLRTNYHSAFSLTRDGKNYLLRLQKDVSFLNKAPLRGMLLDIEEDSFLVIDGTRAAFIDQDIMETLEDFIKAASDNNIRVELKNMKGMAAPANNALAPA
ncbi:SulP family inorganic anion transporter [Methylocystis parvus]|uniref:SulP family inorganic anion transporter n=1 Tax=Methylocystis parvus TaxID=134 RepID=A0A6B8M1N2_9HYPH|nr:SulP family inorganic anion transporter [Methylocystis parvus]QGM96192.1 SulP family inorganic anion transporter [Methylocystis parvus]WBJ99982.1 SulP family inorganic anion transporter [Methylocystis parvus OBBP]